MKRLLLAPAVIFAALNSPIRAATIEVTPTTYVASLAAVQCGDTLHAAPGTYPAATLEYKTCVAPLLPIAFVAPDTAVFGMLTLDHIDGFHAVGGSFSNNNTATGGKLPYGVKLLYGSNISFDRPLFYNNNTALSASFTTNLTINGFECLAQKQDCIDLYATQHVKVLKGIVHGGFPYWWAHPDGIQARSIFPDPPLLDIEIAYNVFIGHTSGAVRFGDRQKASLINVHDNDGWITLALVALQADDQGCDNCSIVNNHGHTSRDSPFITNVVPRAPYAGFAGTVSGNSVSERPAPMPK